jgi:EmrB/QacA subfamily drug resistance transporter
MRKWLPLVTVCLGTFMLLIDVTIVNVALPQMSTDLNTTFSTLQWVIDGYALSLGVLLLGAGALSDMYGHRRFYVGGLILFAAASLACGLAADPALLVAARVVQGAGAAAMFTTTFALLNSSYHGRERGVAYGIWGGVSGAATAVGPVLGGLLTEGFSWRWIFLVNLPICVAAVVMCFTALRRDGARRPGTFDLWGTITFTIAAGTLTYAVIRANDEGWSSVKTWGLLIVSAVALVAFALIEKYREHPMFDLALLRNRSFAGILTAGLLVNFAAFAALTFTSIWLQSVVGMSPLQAGLVGLPMSLFSVLASGFAGAKLHGASPRLLIGGGMLLIAAGSLLCGLLIGADSGWPALLPGYAVIGLGVGLMLPVLSSSAMTAVPHSRGGMAAGSLTTARQLGHAIGIAILGTLFASRAADHLGDTSAAHAVAAGQAGRLTGAFSEHVIRGAAAAGLDAGFYTAGVVGLVGALAVFLLVRPSRAPEPEKQPAMAA